MHLSISKLKSNPELAFSGCLGETEMTPNSVSNKKLSPRMSGLFWFQGGKELRGEGEGEWGGGEKNLNFKGTRSLANS